MTNRGIGARLVGVILVLCLGAAPIAQGIPGGAATDISGTWGAMGGPGAANSLPGDYLGMPINDEARARADAWMSSYKSVPERQCIMYTSQYLVNGPGALQITSDVDPLSGAVIAWKMTGTLDRMPRTIWMDGRPHPSEYARHTPAGFSTGRWQDNVLVIRTTHLIEGVLTITGLPSSSQATIDEFIIRRGTSQLITTMILNDPIYLEEPFIRSRRWVLNPAARIVPQPCEPVFELARPAGTVPHFLPGTNPSLNEAAVKYRLPLEAVRGGAATTRPEYRNRLESLRPASESAK